MDCTGTYFIYSAVSCIVYEPVRTVQPVPGKRVTIVIMDFNWWLIRVALELVFL